MSKITEATEIFVPEYINLSEIYEEHEDAHWAPKEANMDEDVKQWKRGELNLREALKQNPDLSEDAINEIKENLISDQEKEFIKMVLRLFTQADTDVCGGYVDKLLPVFKNADARIMLLSFAARECFDSETEVLTNEGWKLFSELSEDELLAQYDMNTGSIDYAEPLDYVAKPYKGLMHHYKSRRNDIMVTPNHDILVKTYNKNGILKKRKSKDGKWGRNYLYPSAATSQSNIEEINSFEKLLIAIQADGTILNACPGYDRGDHTKTIISFKLKKERKISKLKNLLEDLNLNCNPRLLHFLSLDANGYTIFKFSIDFPNFKELKTFGWIDSLKLSQGNAKSIVNEVLFWDGHVSEKNTVKNWYNTNENAVDKFQEICTVAGITATKGVNRHEGEEQLIHNNKHTSIIKTCYVVTLSDSPWKEYPYREEVEYDDYVYCATMPKGTVVTRRNGKVSIQGNCTHMIGYKRLNDTLGYDTESFLKEFLNYKEMADKHLFMIEEADMSTPKGIGEYLAKQILIEGVNLFAAFAMLLNYSNRGLLPGMVSVNKWSVIDESLHVRGLSELFKILVKENPEIVNDEFKKAIYETARTVIKLEDDFIDLCYSVGENSGLDKGQLKEYIRFVCDYRMQQLGLKPQFGISETPFPWIERITGNVFGNFFEKTITEYSKNNLSGPWKY